jgi:DNA-binding transcriptional regulator YiaG
MALAWLSSDKPARAVANAWRALAIETKRRTTVEDLCGGADITVTEFFRSVYRTGLELNGLFPRLSDLPIPMLSLRNRGGSDADVSLEINMSRASVKSAFEAKLMLGEPLELFLAPRKYRRRLNHLLALWKAQACDYVAIMRRRWRLSQAQFAGLFMTDVRVVKRWEAHEAQPTIRHQWFLRLFALYVKEHGLGTFRRRFVGQRPRYGRRGRPTNAVRSVASSR